MRVFYMVLLLALFSPCSLTQAGDKGTELATLVAANRLSIVGQSTHQKPPTHPIRIPTKTPKKESKARYDSDYPSDTDEGLADNPPHRSMSLTPTGHLSMPSPVLNGTSLSPASTPSSRSSSHESGSRTRSPSSRGSRGSWVPFLDLSVASRSLYNPYGQRYSN